MPLSLLLALATAQAITQPPDVLVTGATGRLGSLLYQQAKADARIGSVRAFVTNVTRARATLGCQKCDPSEGIYVGDVRNPLALNAAANGVDAVLVAVGASPSDTPAVAKAIEVDGVEVDVDQKELAEAYAAPEPDPPPAPPTPEEGEEAAPAPEAPARRVPVPDERGERWSLEVGDLGPIEEGDEDADDAGSGPPSDDDDDDAIEELAELAKNCTAAERAKKTHRARQLVGEFECSRAVRELESKGMGDLSDVNL